jgi:hypothetical protein
VSVEVAQNQRGRFASDGSAAVDDAQSSLFSCQEGGEARKPRKSLTAFEKKICSWWNKNLR